MVSIYQQLRRKLPDVPSSAIQKAMVDASEKLQVIIQREGDDNGARRTERYFVALAMEQLRSNFWAKKTLDAAATASSNDSTKIDKSSNTIISILADYAGKVKEDIWTVT